MNKPREEKKEKIMNKGNKMSDNIISKQDIINVIGDALKSKVSDELKGYNSPLIPMVKEVVEDQTESLKAVIRESLDNISKNTEFKKVIREEFMHKVAKTMVSQLEGTVEKAVNAIRQDQTVRARMILAIEDIIAEQESK